MQIRTIFAVLITTALGAATGLAVADDSLPQGRDGQTATGKCEEALVSPVTGNAECVRTRGAPVDPPPQSAVPCSKQTASGEKRGCPKQAE